MTSLQKVGGVAGLLLTALFLTSFIFILLIWPMYGVTGPPAVRNPAIILPAVANAPLLLFWLALDVPIAATLLLVILALDERLRAGSPAVVRSATILGLAAALLFFAVGGLRFTGYPQLSSLYSQDPGAVGAAYLGYLVVDNGLDRAAIFASGWWLLLMNWVALQLHGWSKALSYLGLLVGVAGILGGAMPSLAPLALLLYIVWFLWLGMTLVRDPSLVAPPSTARP